MHDFEAAVFAQPGGGEVALVAAFALEMRGFEGDVADFEDFDRDAMVFILAQGFQQPRQQGRPHDLIFRRFRIRKADGRGAVVDAVEMGEVFGVGAED